MFKKLFLSLMAIMMIVSVGFASPLTDYSKGKTSIDITWRPSGDITDKWKGSSVFNGTQRGEAKDSTWDWRITSGIGDNWAIQYSQYNAIARPADEEIGVRTQELNVLYKLNKNVAAFAGCHWAEYNNIYATTTPTKNTMQIGLVGNAEIANKTNIYSVIGFGKDLTNFESGISYEFAKNTEFNVSYRYERVHDLHDAFSNGAKYTEDVVLKGWGYGITYKF